MEGVPLFYIEVEDELPGVWRMSYTQQLTGNFVTRDAAYAALVIFGGNTKKYRVICLHPDQVIKGKREVLMSLTIKRDFSEAEV